MEESKYSRVVDLGVSIPCVMCDPRREVVDAVVLVANDIELPFDAQDPESEVYSVQCYSPVCYDCLVAAYDSSSRRSPLIHLIRDGEQAPESTDADMSGIRLSAGIVEVIIEAWTDGKESASKLPSMDSIRAVMKRVFEFVHDGASVEAMETLHSELGLSLKLSKAIVDLVKSAQSPVWRR